MGIVDTGNENFRSAWTDSRDRLDTCDTRIVLADRLELFDDEVKLRGECIQERQSDVELPFPKFLVTALCQ